MEIEEVKLWQWMLAGLVVGALASCVIAWSAPRYEGQQRETVLEGEFENSAYPFAIYSKIVDDGGKEAQAERPKIRNFEDYHKDQPLLRYVMVHLPQKGDPLHRYAVTGEHYFVGHRPKDAAKPNGPQEMYEEWRPFEYAASTPYIPGYAEHLAVQAKASQEHPDRPERHSPLDIDAANLKKSLGGKESFPTVVEYLKAVEALPNSKFTFRQAWWEKSAAIWGMPTLAGFLIIGVAWPLTLSILQNFGVAKPAPVKAKPKPLAMPEPMRVASTAGVVIIPNKPVPPPVTAEAKKYGGEFYPVVKIAEHHEEAGKMAAPTAGAAKAKAAPAKTK